MYIEFLKIKHEYNNLRIPKNELEKLFICD